jgi:hypothetical protein
MERQVGNELDLANPFPPRHHEVDLGLTHKAESRIA